MAPKEETLIELIVSIPWPFWLMLGILAAIVLWTLIFDRDKPKGPIWDEEVWNKRTGRKKPKR